MPIVLIDPHTHINPHRPASTTLADILGYHYYTELIHSAGMPREAIEQPGLSPKELVGRLVGGSSRSRTRFNPVGCWRSPAAFLDLPRNGSRRKTGTALRLRSRANGRRRLAAAGAREEPA